jgi:hypothetical protein
MARSGPKKKQRTKTAHYVPQFYQRGFTNASDRLFCYDKVSDKSYPTSTEAAAQEPYFYEIPPGGLENVNIPLNTVEKALSALERTWAPALRDFIASADAGSVSAQQVVDLAPFVVTQWLRTKAQREACYETMRKWFQAQVDDIVSVNNLGVDLTVHLGTRGLSALHAQQFLDERVVGRMASDLERLYWVVGINDTDHPFYTSDHPVVRRGNQRAQDGRVMVGVRDPGFEFVFPLDSTHILLILEKTHFAAWRQYDNMTVKLSPEQIRDYNSLQVMRSAQRVLCAKDDFEVARAVCAAHPGVRDPNRPRIVVENTPIVNMRNESMVIALE